MIWGYRLPHFRKSSFGIGRGDNGLCIHLSVGIECEKIDGKWESNMAGHWEIELNRALGKIIQGTRDIIDEFFIFQLE